MYSRPFSFGVVSGDSYNTNTLVTHNEAHSSHFYFGSLLFDDLMVFPVVISIEKTTSPRLRPMDPTPPTYQNQLGAAGAELL